MANMHALSRKNKGTKYRLTVIDVFSKYAWAIPVKKKGGPEMKNAFELLFQISNLRKPDKLQTDARRNFSIRIYKNLYSFMGSYILFPKVIRKLQ